MLLRFVDRRPVSAVTTQFLAWLTAPLAAAGKRALLMVWDNASWHVSHAVRAWLKSHNRRVKRAGGGCRGLRLSGLNPTEQVYCRTHEATPGCHATARDHLSHPGGGAPAVCSHHR